VNRTSEAAFETAIESVLLGNGYTPVDGQGFDRERSIFAAEVLAFIQATQESVWKKLDALHGAQTGDRVLESLCKWLDTHGALATLRHGFKCFGKTLRVAFFRPAHGLNPELEARYQANRLGLTRQLHFSPKSEKSLDVVLSVNGIPVVTLELKNPLSGQTVANAIHQYRNDRDPREPIFEFTKRTLVHFAVDTEEAHMATRLAGPATHFLPFNRGADGGAGNPPDKAGRNYKTAYLWEEVLQRDSLLDLLARFLHVDVEEKVSDGRRQEAAQGKPDLSALPPAASRAPDRGRRRNGGCRPQLPGGALGRQRQEQHPGLAGASPFQPAQRRRTNGFSTAWW
jgi:type I restriction enzyme R subunit